MTTVRLAAIAAFAIIVTGGASAHEPFIFCGGSDTSGHCSAAPRPSVPIVPPAVTRFDGIDRTTTSAVPRAQGSPSAPSSGGGFVDQPIGPNTSIRGQQAPSLGTTGDLPPGTGSSSSPGTGGGSSLSGGGSSGSLQ